MSTPRYLKKQGDPDSMIHIFTEGLFARGDMVEVFVAPVEVVIEPTVVVVEDGAAKVGADALPPVADERTGQIRAAILAVPVESYSQAVGSRPAMPKVAAVSELAGFKVSANEIAEIVKTL